MSCKRYKTFLVVFVGGCLLGLPSCGHDQQLVGITIQPSTETFGDAKTPVFLDRGATVQLRALGSYIHPPVTKDITTQVTWASNTPAMVTVDPKSGVITATGEVCGDTIISATVTTNKSAGGISSSGALVSGTMTASVVCFTGSARPNSNPSENLQAQLLEGSF
jgi:hypothetical protein